MEDIKNQVREVWNHHAPNYDQKHNQFEDRKIWKQILVDQIGDDKQQKVLDIGTGTGFLAELAAEAGYHSTGIDLAERMIEQAKQRAIKQGLKITYLIGDWNQLSCDDASFDVIVNRCIMWTIFAPEKTLAEWRRVLKPGGRILCFCPQNTNNEQPNHYHENIETKLPLRNADIDQLSQVLKENNFNQIEKIKLNNLKSANLFESWSLIKGVK